MGLRSIFSEAIRNIGSGTAHALALFLVVLLGGVLLGGYEPTLWWPWSVSR